MNDLAKIIIGTIVTVVIGGVAYNVNQDDIAEYFSRDTGMTQEQAKDYIENIDEEYFASWAEVGYEEISIGNELLKVVNEIDCEKYEYEWETPTLSCFDGKKQLTEVAQNNILLGESYLKLDKESASINDMRETVRLIDRNNLNYEFDIFLFIYNREEIEYIKRINSYNKALLQAVLDSMD